MSVVANVEARPFYALLLDAEKFKRVEFGLFLGSVVNCLIVEGECDYRSQEGVKIYERMDCGSQISIK